MKSRIRVSVVKQLLIERTLQSRLREMMMDMCNKPESE